jgi:ferredoxin-NADP reductase
MTAMRMRQTPFKSALRAAALGTKFTVSRTRGSFTLHRNITRPAVFLAGAFGIAPIHSILQSATQVLCSNPHDAQLEEEAVANITERSRLRSFH